MTFDDKALAAGSVIAASVSCMSRSPSVRRRHDGFR